MEKILVEKNDVPGLIFLKCHYNIVSFVYLLKTHIIQNLLYQFFHIMCLEMVSELPRN